MAVFLARMVMPRSRSRSLESITRSTMGLVGAEGAALVQHGVHQSGLAVVDVRDDGDIADTLLKTSDPFSIPADRPTNQVHGMR